MKKEFTKPQKYIKKFKKYKNLNVDYVSAHKSTSNKKKWYFLLQMHCGIERIGSQ